jgi:hypothetical protein
MKTAVEWLQSQIVFESVDEELLARWDEDSDLSEYFEQALQMEKEQKIKAQIEILYSIGNNGANAPLYGILKTTLLDLQEQLKQQEK